MKKTELALAFTFALAATGLAMAHGGAIGIVKERMDGMSAMGDAMKTLSSMMRGDIPFDQEQVKTDAASIQMHAGKTLTDLFPEGSGGVPSEAKDEVWSNWEEFEELAVELELYAKALGVAAPNGLMMEQASSTDMMGTSNSTMMGTKAPLDLNALAEMPVDGVFNMLAQTCANCHSNFRNEKK